MNVNLIVNPVAGNRAFRAVKKIEALLKRKVSLNTFITREKGDAESFAKQISSQFTVHSSQFLVIVAGGDGTFNEVINGILSGGKTGTNEIPLALIPLGTTNVLAKELGIPENVEGAIEVALTGTPKTVSLGRIVVTRHLPAEQAGSSPLNQVQGSRYFCLMAGIGFDGEAVYNAKNSIKKISGKGAYILSGINTLLRYYPSLIEVKTPEGTFTGYTAVVGKAHCYGGYFQVTPKARLTEPLLDLCLFKGKTRKDIIRLVNGVIRKRHLDFDDVVYGKFSELEVSSEGRVYVQIDGDYFGTLPVKIDVVKDAASVIW